MKRLLQVSLLLSSLLVISSDKPVYCSESDNGYRLDCFRNGTLARLFMRDPSGRGSVSVAISDERGRALHHARVIREFLQRGSQIGNNIQRQNQLLDEREQLLRDREAFLAGMIKKQRVRTACFLSAARRARENSRKSDQGKVFEKGC